MRKPQSYYKVLSERLKKLQANADAQYEFQIMCILPYLPKMTKLFGFDRVFFQSL